MSFYIYAETAFHHEGSKVYLKKLVREAKKSGVAGVKFQVLIDLNDLMSSHHSSYEESKKWVLTLNEWKDVFEYTIQLGLDIILMPVDIKAFDLANYYNVKYIEIHSVSFKDKKFFSKLNEYDTPLILGIGGRTLDEIDEVVNTYSDRDVVLMAGFQSYPSDLADIRLSRIQELLKMYPDCTIGYADHSSYDDEMAISSNEYAYVMGARVFEKHIALEEGKKRIDFQSAVGVNKIKSIIYKLDYLDQVLISKDVFDMSKNEINYRKRQKMPVAKYDLDTGHVLSEADLELKMLDTDNAVEDISGLIGKKLKIKVKFDCAFTEKHFQ